MREFASGQIKKGVRSIGMGGDGATWGNYALVYRDADTALFDAGEVHFSDTGNTFGFTAVGATSPSFWGDAALYVIGLSQQATDLHVWTRTSPNPTKPPSLGDGSDQAVFVKFAKPISSTVSLGLLGSYEISQMTLLPFDGSPAIRFQTEWRPSGGFGMTWQPNRMLLVGARALFNRDLEIRSSGGADKEGELRSDEYRAGVSLLPWRGGLLDVGVVALSRYSGLDRTSFHRVEPTFGVEQAVLPDRFWVRVGRDETTWTGGISVQAAPLKLDLAYVNNLAEIRTGDIFGKKNSGVIGTITLKYR
ncbi:MAG TPA: hypothetical protein VFA47_13535 [Candidatus Manganitrophaceae bacterium]|nr:hypothetical protein [Candidatus Manganitrophaceae bacterium]